MHDYENSEKNEGENLKLKFFKRNLVIDSNYACMSNLYLWLHHFLKLDIISDSYSRNFLAEIFKNIVYTLDNYDYTWFELKLV